MKKLISAVTSLCMAATMVSAVVPATVGAADSTKGFSIKTYDAANPSAASGKSEVTIDKKDIPADGYVLSSALYYSEATDNSTGSLLVGLTTDSKDIQLKLYDPAGSYASEKKEYTLGGVTFTTDSYISFAGYCKSARSGYKAGGKYVLANEPSQSAAKTDNYYIGCSWMNNGADYAWAGEASDSYPFYVFDTIIPQSIEAGTYKVMFCDYNTDTTGVNDNPSPMVEAGGSRFTKKDGNLKLSELTINVTDGGTTPATTTKADEPKTTTTTKADEPKTTTTKADTPVEKSDVNFTFVDENGNSTVKIESGKGAEIPVDVLIDAGDNKISALDVNFKLSDGIKLAEILDGANAFPKSTVSGNVEKLHANYTTLDGDATVNAKNGESAFMLTINVPAGTPDGTYTVSFGDQIQVFKDNTKFNYGTSVKPLTIEVGNGGGSSAVGTTTTKKDEPAVTTTTKADTPISNADVKFSFVDEKGSNAVTVASGKGAEIPVDVIIEAGDNKISALDVDFKLTKGIELAEILDGANAFPKSTVSGNVEKLHANYTTLDGDATVNAKNGESAFMLTIKVPAGTPDGTYTVDFGEQVQVFRDNTKFNYSTSSTPLTITVGEPSVVTTTTKDEPKVTTTTTVTTAKEDPKTTTTTKKDEPATTTTLPSSGDKVKVSLWGDANCNGVVNVGDLVVIAHLVKDPNYVIEDETGKIDSALLQKQGRVNADVVDPQDINGGEVDPAGVKITGADADHISSTIIKDFGAKITPKKS